jgi:MYXO-CTERM domain-containing protein
MQPYTLLWLTLSNAEAGTSYLTDASGLRFQIVDDTRSSGTFPEASYVSYVAASTVSGGTTSQVLGDMFDGYGTIYVDKTRYGGNGPATLDCDDRQLIFGTETMGVFSVWRKVYVPDDDAFARSVVFVTNNDTADQSTFMGLAGNLGSDGNTTVMADYSGDVSVGLEDDWAVSMEGFSGTISYDPRIGHIWQNGGGIVADEIDLNDGNDNFHWRFTLDIPAGETVAIATFVTGQPTWPAAQAQVEALALMPDTATACLTEEEWDQVVNWGVDCRYLDDQCNDGVYDEPSKACVATPINEAGACDDGLTCTLKDVCGAGICAGTETAEVTGNGIDEDCDVGEICFADADDDGHAAKGGATVVSADLDCDDAGEATNADPADDCDDADAGAYPGATEIANDDVDQDCDGADLVEKTADDSGGAGDDTGGAGNGGGDDGGGDDAGGDGDTDGGCSCAVGSTAAPWALVLALVGLVARRRRA